LQLGFVAAKEWVVDLLVGQQIQVNVAGDSGRQPACFRLLRRGSNLPELPTVIQSQNRILRGLCLRLCPRNCIRSREK
jgi:hypothetical protein